MLSRLNEESVLYRLGKVIAIAVYLAGVAMIAFPVFRDYYTGCTELFGVCIQEKADDPFYSLLLPGVATAIAMALSALAAILAVTVILYVVSGPPRKSQTCPLRAKCPLEGRNRHQRQGIPLPGRDV